ncbi:MAG: flavodoxin family protein [Clostridium butyricum]|nr:flavodoxin family protein [Clostridium butyricum]
MLLIHDLTDENQKRIETLIPSEAKIFSKSVENIHPCLGCFKCWIKTPGKCIINDSYTEIPKYFKEADKILIISEIRYGSYSPYIKRVIERSIGFLLPFFRLYHGEMHHKIRYDINSELIFIGYCSSITDQEENTFKDLVKGNARNLGIEKYSSYLTKNINEIEQIINNIL